MRRWLLRVAEDVHTISSDHRIIYLLRTEAPPNPSSFFVFPSLITISNLIKVKNSRKCNWVSGSLSTYTFSLNSFLLESSHSCELGVVYFGFLLLVLQIYSNSILVYFKNHTSQCNSCRAS